MRIVAVGSRSLVSGFRLAGGEGIEVSTPEEAMRQLQRLLGEKDVGLVLLGDNVARPIRRELTQMRSKRAVPLIYAVPAPGSKPERIEYRELLRQILGV